MSMFRKAERSEARPKLAVPGSVGSGTTTAAIFIATSLAEGDASKITAVGTDAGSADPYAKAASPFGVLAFGSPVPAALVQSIHGPAREGFRVAVLDIVSHALQSHLDEKTTEEASNQCTNAFALWAKNTRLWDPLTRAILRDGFSYEVSVVFATRYAWHSVDARLNIEHAMARHSSRERHLMQRLHLETASCGELAADVGVTANTVPHGTLAAVAWMRRMRLEAA